MQAVRGAIAFATGLAMVVAAPGARAFGLDLPVERQVFANGLRVVVAPDPLLGEAVVLVRYDVGAADDPNGYEGLAHLVEHLQFDGSKHVGAGQHARLIEEAGGGGFVGLTGPDSTTYAERVPPGAVPLALWLESDRMGFFLDGLDEATVAHERVIVGHEFDTRISDTQVGPILELLRNDVFPVWHPYHLPERWNGIPGGAGVEDVRAFVRTWYSPSNATLIVVGPIDPQLTFELARKYFERLPSAPPPPRPSLPSWTVGDVVTGVSALVPQTEVLVAWKAPGLHEPGDRELDVAATLLAGANGTLVHDLAGTGLATAVAARQNSLDRASIFTVVVQVPEGQSVTPVGEVIERDIAALARGPDAAAVSRACRARTAADLMALETALGRAQRLAVHRDADDPWGLEAYRRIGPAAVAASVRHFLVPEARATAVAFPATKAFPGLARYVVQSRERRLP